MLAFLRLPKSNKTQVSAYSPANPSPVVGGITSTRVPFSVMGNPPENIFNTHAPTAFPDKNPFINYQHDSAIPGSHRELNAIDPLWPQIGEIFNTGKEFNLYSLIPQQISKLQINNYVNVVPGPIPQDFSTIYE